jgi:hypothetical protein
MGRYNRPVRAHPSFAIAIGAAALTGCSYNWYSVVPASPAVIPHRGSAVVTIAVQNTRLKMHHQPATLFGEPEREGIAGSETVVVGYHNLDVRTCKDTKAWRAPSGPEPDGSDIPLAERGMIGPVRFHASNGDLMATDTATAVTWTAARGFGQIVSVTAVPAARRVVVAAVLRLIYVYDLDAKRVILCP